MTSPHNRRQAAIIWVRREIGGLEYTYPMPGTRDPVTGREFVSRSDSVRMRNLVMDSWNGQPEQGFAHITIAPIVSFAHIGTDYPFGTGQVVDTGSDIVLASSQGAGDLA